MICVRGNRRLGRADAVAQRVRRPRSGAALPALWPGSQSDSADDRRAPLATLVAAGRARETDARRRPQGCSTSWTAITLLWIAEANCVSSLPHRILSPHLRLPTRRGEGAGLAVVLAGRASGGVRGRPGRGRCGRRPSAKGGTHGGGASAPSRTLARRREGARGTSVPSRTLERRGVAPCR